MENSEEEKTIKESILATIESGEVKMRPRWHFMLKTILASLGVTILALTILYLASFIIFVLRQTGVLFMPAFGSEGWYAFFTHLPFFLICLLVIFIFILELFVRHYAFAYRRPLLYSAMGIFILATIGSLMVLNTSLHSDVSKYADENEETFVGKFYVEYERQRFADVHRGMIIEMDSDGFMMRNRREENLTIIVSRQTRFPTGADFSLGDIVVVFGHREGDGVQAFGVQKVCGIQGRCE